MKNIVKSAAALLALCALASAASANPTTGPDNNVGGKGPNGSFASTQKGDMGTHASGGKNVRD